MKNMIKKALFISVICAAAVCVCAGCNNKSDNTSAASKSESNTSMTSASTTSDSEASSSGEKEEIISEASAEESKEEQSSDISESSEEESKTEVSEESKTEESSENSGEEEPDESQAAEVSIDGYQFDDEQIVKDYHTATEFTSNEEFNKLFSGNALDVQYQQELQSADTLNSMRNTTISYAEKWKELSTRVYDDLHTKLADRPEEQAKLEQSQDEWIKSISETESSFNSEASSGGTEALLSADAAMMNYFKGRTAVLLEQIYELDATVDLSVYGL